MRVLALDTTARVSSAAVIDDSELVAERIGDATRSHAESLPTELLAVLAQARVELAAIDVFAVAAGPGSFTGLRIGIATMQGLAFVRRKPIVAVSALDALARAADAAAGARVAALIDAHRRDVFSALYCVAGAPTPIDQPSVAAPGVTLARWSDAGLTPDVVIGSGATLYAELILAAAPRSRIIAERPLAAVIGRIAVERARAGGAVDPAAVQPLYIRRPDAELAREKVHPSGTRPQR